MLLVQKAYFFKVDIEVAVRIYKQIILLWFDLGAAC